MRRVKQTKEQACQYLDRKSGTQEIPVAPFRTHNVVIFERVSFPAKWIVKEDHALKEQNPRQDDGGL
jgi:hypothetical protein